MSGPAQDRRGRPLAELAPGASGRVLALRVPTAPRQPAASPLRPGAVVYVVEATGGRWLHVRIDFREYSIPVDLAELVLVVETGAPAPADGPARAADAYAVLRSRVARGLWQVRVIERSSGAVAASELFDREADARARLDELERDAARLDPTAFRARHALA